MSGIVELEYDGFISYRHSNRQVAVASALQRALHHFAKSPWYSLRATRLYRDETDLNANPDAWAAVQKALDASRYLLLIASPEAAASRWVDEELRHWLDTKGQSKLIIILADGSLNWDKNVGCFDPATTNALPQSALEGITSEPLWVDLSEIASERLKIDEPAFMNAIASVSSALRGIPKDELLGEDRRLQRSRLRFVSGALVGIVLLAVVAIAVTVELSQTQIELAREAERAAKADIDREVAEALAEERAIAARRELVRALASQSLARAEDGYAEDALKLAIASWPRKAQGSLPQTQAAVRALHTALMTHAPVRDLPLERSFTASGVDLAVPYYEGRFVVLVNRANEFVLLDSELDGIVYSSIRDNSWITRVEDPLVAVSRDGRSILITGQSDLLTETTKVRHFRLGESKNDDSIHIQVDESLEFEGDIQGIGFIDETDLVGVAANAGIGLDARGILYSIRLSKRDATDRLSRENAAWSAELQDRIAFPATVSPNGIVVGVGGWGRYPDSLELRSAMNGSLIWHFSEAGQYGHQLSPDGSWLATADDDLVRVWRLTGAEPWVRTPIQTGPESVTGLTVSPDGATLAIASSTGKIRLVDATGGAALRILRAEPAPIHRIAFSNDGQHLLNLNDETYWNLSVFGAIGFAKTPEALSGLPRESDAITFSALSSTGAGTDLRLATTTYDGPFNFSAPRRWPLSETWERLSLADQRFSLISFAPDGTVTAVGGKDGGMALIDQDFDVIWSETDEGDLTQLAFSQTGETLVGFSDIDLRLIARSTANGSLLSAATLDWSDGALLGITDNAALLIDDHYQERLHRFADHSGPEYLVDSGVVPYSVCSRSSGSCGPSIDRNWLRGDTGDVWATAGTFIGDDGFAAIAYNNGDLAVFDTETLRPVQVFSIQASERELDRELSGVSYRAQTGDLLISTEAIGSTSHVLILNPESPEEAIWISELVPMGSKIGGDRLTQYLSTDGEVLVLLGRTSSGKLQAVDLDLKVAYPPISVSTTPRRLTLSDDGADLIWVDSPESEIRHVRLPVGRDIFIEACKLLADESLDEILSLGQLNEVEPICDQDYQPAEINPEELK